MPLLPSPPITRWHRADMPVTVEEVIAPRAYGARPPLPVNQIIVTRRQLRLQLLSLGAAIHSLEVPNASGELRNVHLSLDHVSDYADAALNPHFGATIGRYANRIGHSRFTLDGTEYAVDCNRPPNTLHGGTWGFDRVVWQIAEVSSSDTSDRIVFRLHSPSGDMGFPGNLIAESTYIVDDESVTFEYSAVTDAPTVVSFANHGYWNLSGAPTIADHELTVSARRVLASGDDQLPTGELNDVTGTPFDLRAPRRIGDVLADVPGGLDHCWVFDDADLDVSERAPRLRTVAHLSAGGRSMTVATDCPGMQVYTGNALKPPFAVHQSVSLETQRLPDAPNHPHFGPCALRPGNEYRSTTKLTFGTRTSESQ